MSLADDLANDNLFRHASGGKCTFCVFLKNLDKASLAKINERLVREDTTSASIARVLKKNGIEIKDGVISRHRRGDCAGAK